MTSNHGLIATPRHAEDPISSSVPPPSPLPVGVDPLELDVIVEDSMVCDVVEIEREEGEFAAIVVPTITTVVVVESEAVVVEEEVAVEELRAACSVVDAKVVEREVEELENEFVVEELVAELAAAVPT